MLQKHAWSQNLAARAATVSIHSRTGRVVSETFTGLSYELAQLTEPTFFSAQNAGLVALFKRLSPRGLLRLGGNTSEFCWFRADASTLPPKLHVPPGDLATNWMPHRLFEIHPEAIDSLAGFLDATGWNVIYGLNFGNGSPERAAVEAAYVANRLGSRLAFFQIGNEPDFYRDANNGTRPPGWGFDDYLREWQAFANAIIAKVPHARFGAPDVGSSSDWVTRFGDKMAPQLGAHLVALSAHYYAEGPPDNPRVTIQRLLTGGSSVTTSTKAIVQVADSHHLEYHMTEGNSCYRGGKPGMSDAFASALWAGDYMLLLASLGCAGVNLHGGDSRFLSAGLGDHNPGLKVANGKATAPNGFYTPISTELGHPPSPRPIFYGMLLAQQFAGATFLSADVSADPDLTTYSARTGNTILLALFNKDLSQSISVTAQKDGRCSKASMWRLSAPAVNATSHVTLGEAEIANDGSWHPRAEPLEIRNGEVRVELPPASAALVFLR